MLHMHSLIDRVRARLSLTEAAAVATEPPTKLARHQVLSFEGRPGQRLEVLRGRVWVTQTDRPGDFLPGAGDVVVLRGYGKVVVEALRPSAFVVAHVTAPAPRASTESHVRLLRAVSADAGASAAA